MEDRNDKYKCIWKRAVQKKPGGRETAVQKMHGGRTTAERKGKAIRKAWRGSYTVEAAAVLSLTVLILGTLLIGAFYVHDRAVCQSLVCETAAVGSCFATEQERAAAMKAAAKHIRAARFLGSKKLNGSAKTGKSEASVVWSAEYPVPGFAMRYLNRGSLAVNSSWSSKITEPTGTIRLIRGAGKLLTGGED